MTFDAHTLDLLRERVDIRAVFEDAGVKLRGRANLSGRCPFHDDRSPSLSVGLAKGCFVCFGCGASGDAIEAYQRLHDVDFRQAVRELADQAGVFLSEERTEKRRYRDRSIRAPYVPPPPVYPPEEQVTAIARYCRPVSEDEQVATYLRRRGIDAAAVAAHRLAFALRSDAPSTAVPHHRPDDRGVLPWTATHHRLVVPMFDASGVRRNAVARSVVLLPVRKTAVTGTCAGLVFANDGALRILRDGLAALPLTSEPAALEWPIPRGSALAARTVVIAEGEIDFLRFAADRGDCAAVFGIRTGSWTQAYADRLPVGAHLVIATDDDKAGDQYAEAIRHTIADRLRLGTLTAVRVPFRDQA